MEHHFEHLQPRQLQHFAWKLPVEAVKCQSLDSPEHVAARQQSPICALSCSCGMDSACCVSCGSSLRLCFAESSESCKAAASKSGATLRLGDIRRSSILDSLSPCNSEA